MTVKCGTDLSTEKCGSGKCGKHCRTDWKIRKWNLKYVFLSAAGEQDEVSKLHRERVPRARGPVVDVRHSGETNPRI